MTGPDPATLVDGVDIDAVHQLLTSTPGVSRIGSGLPGAMTTYLPGRRVPGVRITPSAVEVEVVGAWGANVPELARTIQHRLGGFVGNRSVDVTITDLDLPGETDLPDANASSAESEK